MSTPNDGSFNPQYGLPAPSSPNRTPLIIGIVVAGVLCAVCAVIGLAVAFFLPTGTTSQITAQATLFTGTQTPLEALLTPNPDWQQSYFETFDNNSSQWSVGKKDSDTGTASVTRSVDSGVYRWEMTATTDFSWWVWGPPDENITDSVTAIDARKVSGDADKISYGIAFRGTNDELYLYQISDDGFWSLSLLKNDDWQTLDSGTSTAVLADQFNHIVVVAKGTSLSLLVNNELVKTVEDTTLASGSVGIAAEAADNTTGTVEFDNLEVYYP
jgi:hypothetical protein